jgi:hypothetical protein
MNNVFVILSYILIKGKAVALQQAVETHRSVRRRDLHFIDNRLTYDGEVPGLTLWSPFTPSPGRFLVLISVRG